VASRSSSRRAFWVWNEASQRFGVVAYGDELPDEVAGARHLIGRDADVAEEFDELDL
jgi:hypothetical protein